MDCIAPESIREGDLVAFVEGRASSQVREHIARCAFCAAEAETLAEADHVLTAALYRGSCPETETLLRFQAGLLPARGRRQVARHIVDCSHCASEVQQLAALDSPQYSMWEEMRRAARAVVEAVRVEPLPRPALAVRGEQLDLRRYQAGELDIIVGCEMPPPPRDLWELQGRITRGGLAAAELTDSTARLVQEDQIIACRQVNDLGYFAFDSLPAGQYDLWLEDHEKDVVIHQIIVGTMVQDEIL